MSATGPALRPDDVVPGTKYRVVKTIGAGGMGIVYQVVKPPNIQGVLKLMSSDLTSLEEHRTRFFDEVRILAQLEHPNIVRVFDYDALPDGTPFYVMELLNGRTVRDVIGTLGRVRPRVAFEVIRQLLEALQCAHTHEVPVIHRDIKPENIFLHTPRHGEPLVKLIDFGVSSVGDRKHDGSFVGTWSYAAPEQIRGEAPTPQTDLYAVGLVLYEMLAGVGPFDHHTDWHDVSKAQLTEIPAPVSKFAPWVPTSIVGLIAAALAKDPRARPRDAYAFAERLFELEWANDGKDPYDPTREGPGASPAAAAPIAKVLDTLTAGSRAGETTPNASLLLEGLGAPPRKPASLRERASDPAVAASPPSAPPVPSSNRVILAGADPARARTGESRDPTTPRGNLAVSPRPPTAITVDATPGPPAAAPAIAARDTFSSQQSDARALPRSRAGVVLVGAALLSSLALATVVITRSPPAPSSPPNVTSASVPARATFSTLPPEPSAIPAPSSSSAPVSTEAPAPSVAPPLSTAHDRRPPARPAPSPGKPAVPSAAPPPRSDYWRGNL